MALKPLGDRIVVRFEETEEKTASVAAGDKVLVENGAGINVKDGDDSVSIIREADILAVLA